MASETRRALQDFDNRHDFERLSADVLNALGYSSVEPMAAAGGADGGTDIRFRSGEERGIAFVTLDKKIRDKFARDLAAQPDGAGIIALFCNVDVSPAAKLDFTKDALARGYRLEVFDLERLRSLLDTAVTSLRRRYLKIEDEVAAELRSRVRKLLRFPDAVSDSFKPRTMLESLFRDFTPGRLFELLMEYEEKDIAEVPGIGPSLHKHLVEYYAFRGELEAAEATLLQRIGDTAAVSRLAVQWKIQLRYTISRLSGLSATEVERGGAFLNYGMTWESAEKAHATLDKDEGFVGTLNRIFTREDQLRSIVEQIRTTVDE